MLSNARVDSLGEWVVSQRRDVVTNCLVAKPVMGIQHELNTMNEHRGNCGDYIIESVQGDQLVQALNSLIQLIPAVYFTPFLPVHSFSVPPGLDRNSRRKRRGLQSLWDQVGRDKQAEKEQYRFT
jgi:hypothetical protein